MRDRVIATLKQILTQDLFLEIPPEQIGLDDGLQTVAGLDSVSFVELRVLCERYFRISIEDDEFSPDSFRSLNCLADLIDLKVTTQGVSCVR